MPTVIFSEEDDFGIYAGIWSTLWKQCPEHGIGETTSAPKLKKLVLGLKSLRKQPSNCLMQGSKKHR
jgi:hypothetical protein